MSSIAASPISIVPDPLSFRENVIWEWIEEKKIKDQNSKQQKYTDLTDTNLKHNKTNSARVDLFLNIFKQFVRSTGIAIRHISSGAWANLYVIPKSSE